MITQEELKKRVAYNPDTGVFIWLSVPKNQSVAFQFCEERYRMKFKILPEVIEYLKGEWDDGQPEQ